MFRVVIFCLFLTSCAQEEVPEHNACDSSLVSSQENYLICYNPNSPEHGSLCSEICLASSSDPAPYCWSITKEDCEGKLDFAWQQENCHFFEK